MIRWEWVPANLDVLWDALVDHAVLTVIAVVVGLAISLALSLLIHRHRPLFGPIAGIAGVLYTIPSLALLAFLVPFTGLSLATAEIALVSYTLLILIRNIMAGLDSVPVDVREAADAMGYTPARRLLRVELPLALPLVIAGVRIATVTTIGLVMVTALIGEGGLGQVVLRGFNLQNFAMVYSAIAVTISFAIAADVALAALSRLVTPWARQRTA